MRHLKGIALLALLAAVCGGLLQAVYQEVKAEAIRQLNAQQWILARQAARGIQEFFDHSRGLLQAMAQSRHVVRMDEEGRAFLREIQDANRENIRALTRVDAAGRAVFSAPDAQAVGADLSGQEHVRKILADHLPVVSDVFMSVQGYWSVACHVPVFENGEFAGALGMLIPFEVISRKYVEGIRIAETGYALVISQKGVELYCPVPGHVGRSLFDLARDFPDLTAMAERMVRGEEGEAAYLFDFVRGGHVRTGLKHAVFLPARIENTFWSICVTTPETEVLASISGFRNILLAIGAVLLAGAAAGAWLLLRAVIVEREERRRQQAEEALRESEERIRATFEQAAVGICQCGLDGRFLQVNDRLCEITGYSREELLDLTFREITHPDDLEADLENVRSLLDGKVATYSLEKRYIRKGGAVTWVNIAVSLVRDREHQPEFFIGFIEDISPRKAAEQSLERSEAVYRQLFDNMRSGVAVYQARDQGEDFVFVDFNKGAEAIETVARAEVIGRSVLEAFPGVKEFGLFEVFQKVWRTGIPQSHPVSLYQDNRIAGWRENFVYRLSSGEVVAVYDDVTERKQAEESLHASEERYRQLFEMESDAIFLIANQDGRILEANPAASRMYGYTRDELLSLRNTDLSAEPDQTRKVTREGADLVPLRWHRRKDGAVFPVEITGSFFEWRGQPVHIAAIRDISARLEMEDRLLAAKEAAEAASRAKSEFLATMSHEVRTPLNGVMGMLQLLEGTDLGDEQQEFVRVALDSSSSLLRILSDILDLSRVEAGALDIVDEDFILGEVVGPVLDVFQNEAARKGLDFAWVPDPGLPERLAGDPGRIRQVLFNLLGNAVKYTEQGGVRVEAYAQAHPGRPGEVLLHVVVTDTGIGIPDARLGDVFEPFTQVDGSLTRRHGGSGLGLAIVKRLVRLMGGTLDMVSEPGTGSEAHLSLPLRTAARDRAEPPAAEPPARPARILVVEDESVNLMTTLHMLRRLGHDPAGARDGREALELLRQGGFDCVLMDIQMPGMDGLEATRLVRRGEAGDQARAIPIVALTAHAMSGDREAFLDAGMDDYIAKPVDLDELQATLARLLEREGRAGEGGAA